MYVTKRSGFAMIMAIFIIVLVSLGGVMLLGNVSLGNKSAGDNYFRAQAELLASSATEFALMRAQDMNTSGVNCLNNVNISVVDASGAAAYNVNVSLQYSFKNAAPANGQCNTLSQNSSKDTMVLIDTTVSTNLSTEEVRVTKRTWQKL